MTTVTLPADSFESQTADATPLPRPRPVASDDPGVESYGSLRRAVAGMYHDGGLPQGDSTGWPTLDELYRVHQGQWTVVTGFPGSGKSEFVDALAVNLMETDGWDFAFYSPENYPTAGHVVKLLEKRVRRPFNEGKTPRMSAAEADAGLTWLFQRAYWLNPERASPTELLQMAADRARPGKKLGIVLDPWNTLDHERCGLSETDYISTVLTDVIRAARQLGAHLWLVVHPAKINRDKNGTRPVPTPYDLAGSAHWFNKADNILCVDRDKLSASQSVDIHVQKVRFKHTGQIGLRSLLYDRVVGRYFQWDAPLIAGEWIADPERAP